MTATPPGEATLQTTKKPISIVVISDFVCPWCYVGSMELDRLERDYPDVEVSWAPFLLDPTVPPEGRRVEPRQQPGDPPSPVESRAQQVGLDFARGRTFRPNSHLALELAAFAADKGIDPGPLHRAIYSAHFESLENIGDIDTLVRIATAHGLDPDETREVLTTRHYEEQVDEEIQAVQELGVSAVPTFVFNNEYAIVGAETYPTFQRMMEKLGYPPPAGVEGPPDNVQITFNEPSATGEGDVPDPSD